MMKYSIKAVSSPDCVSPIEPDNTTRGYIASKLWPGYSSIVAVDVVSCSYVAKGITDYSVLGCLHATLV